MKKKGLFVLFVVIVVIAATAALSSQIVETNNSGFYQVKQEFISGKMSVRSEPGLYLRMFGNITTYGISDTFYFSKSDLEGGTGEESQPITVQFRDGGTAQISGSIKFRLSKREEDALRLHEDFRSFRSVQFDLVRQTVIEALIQTAALMKADETYSSRRNEFTVLAETQIREGIFRSEKREIKKLSEDGKEISDTEIYIKLDEETGEPYIQKVSPFKRYNIEIVQFVLKEIDFDDTIDALISQKKKAEQERAVAESNASRAKQDAITAKALGEAKVAEVEAEELAEKMREVTRAEKERDVALLNKERDQALTEAQLISQRAEAEAAKLLVDAGLPPTEKARIEKEIAIGVASELAKIKFPEMMIFGSGEGSPTNPFDALGLEAFMKITRELTPQED